MLLRQPDQVVVPGGGVALLRARSAIGNLKLSGDEQVGAQIVYRALEEPLRQIAENAGEEGSVVAQKVLTEKGNFGFDAQSGQYGDLIQKGIIDPKKVTRTALENAASISGLLLTTEALVTELPEEEKASAMPGGMPPGGGMY